MKSIDFAACVKIRKDIQLDSSKTFTSQSFLLWLSEISLTICFWADNNFTFYDLNDVHQKAFGHVWKGERLNGFWSFWVKVSDLVLVFMKFYLCPGIFLFFKNQSFCQKLLLSIFYKLFWKSFVKSFNELKREKLILIVLKALLKRFFKSSKNIIFQKLKKNYFSKAH